MRNMMIMFCDHDVKHNSDENEWEIYSGEITKFSSCLNELFAVNIIRTGCLCSRLILWVLNMRNNSNKDYFSMKSNLPF